MKLVILDRDGTINVQPDGFIQSADEWQPLPGALEAIAQLNHAGWHVVIATNQGGIGRGLVDMASVNAVHLHMMKLLASKGGRIDAVFFCPHAPEEHCDCRKPGVGMMKDIARRYGVDLATVPMVADTPRDLGAAIAAGCKPHLVCTGRAAHASADELAQWRVDYPGAQIHDHLAAFAEHLLRRDPAAAFSRA